jgi:hypothetical protein
MSEMLSLFENSQASSEAHPVAIKFCTGAISMGVNRPELDADHSPPPSAEVMNERSYRSVPSIRSHGVCTDN